MSGRYEEGTEAPWAVSGHYPVVLRRIVRWANGTKADNEQTIAQPSQRSMSVRVALISD
jgi:hypothetical protein